MRLFVQSQLTYSGRWAYWWRRNNPVCVRGSVRGWIGCRWWAWRGQPSGRRCSRSWNLDCSTYSLTSDFAPRRNTIARTLLSLRSHPDPLSWTRTIYSARLSCPTRKGWTTRSLRSPSFPHVKISWQSVRKSSPRSFWRVYIRNTWKVLHDWVENHGHYRVPRSGYRWHRNLHSWRSRDWDWYRFQSIYRIEIWGCWIVWTHGSSSCSHICDWPYRTYDAPRRECTTPGILEYPSGSLDQDAAQGSIWKAPWSRR